MQETGKQQLECVCVRFVLPFHSLELCDNQRKNTGSTWEFCPELSADLGTSTLVPVGLFHI